MLARRRACGCGRECLAIQGFPHSQWVTVGPEYDLDWTDPQLRDMGGNSFSKCALMPLQLSVLANCPISQAILLVTTDAGEDSIVVDDPLDDPQQSEDHQCRGRKGS